MPAGSLDTNVLLRLLLNDVPEQHVAAMRLYSTATSRLMVTDIAMMEVAFVLGGERYQFNRGQVCEAIEGVMGLPAIACNRALFSKALPLFKAHPSLSFEDCCLAAYAEVDQAEPLWTFDKKLASQAAAAKLLQ